jgi:hypothetical protein
MGGIKLKTRNEPKFFVKAACMLGIIPATPNSIKMQKSFKLTIHPQVCGFRADSHCCKTITLTKETP